MSGAFHTGQQYGSIVKGVWRFMMSKQWWRFWAGAAVFMIICLLLGRWQWGRYEARHAEVSAVNTNYDAPAVPLTSGSPLLAALPSDHEWTRVTVRCAVPPSSLLLVRNRPGPNGVYGYEAVAPCQFVGDTQRGVLLNLGWVPNGPTATTPPAVAPVPTAQPLTVEGWLRPGEINLGREEIRGQLSSIDVAAVSRLSSTDLGSTYVVVGSTSPSATAAEPGSVAPRPLAKPDASMGSHLAYALQWWAASIFGFVLVFAKARRDYATASGDHVATAPPRRTWVWDDEDE